VDASVGNGAFFSKALICCTIEASPGSPLDADQGAASLVTLLLSLIDVVRGLRKAKPTTEHLMIINILQDNKDNPL
jgi:hypothetical protein